MKSLFHDTPSRILGYKPYSSVKSNKNDAKGNLCLLARNKSLEQWFSELARGLTCPCKPLSHDKGHKRTITPGTFTGLVLQSQ